MIDEKDCTHISAEKFTFSVCQLH